MAQEQIVKTLQEVKGATKVAENSRVKTRKVKQKQKKFKLDLSKRSPLIQDIRDKLDYYVIGQDQAKDELVDALARTLHDDPNRTTPIANMMFLGPTGVGKTQVVRALYWILFGDESIGIGKCKIDANKYSQGHEIFDLIGAPPSYVGREQTPILSDKVIFKAFRDAQKKGTLHPILKNYEEFGILLIDEVEKGSEELHDLLLGIMDEGILELNNGAEEGQIGQSSKTSKGSYVLDYHKTTKFKNVIIIMTSNLGAEQIQEKLAGRGEVGFKTSTDSKEKILSVDFYKKIVENTRVFKPEFIGRLDSFIPFKALTKEDLYKRLDLSIKMFNKTYSYTGIRLNLTKRAKTHIVEESYVSAKGARFLVKAFEKEVVTIYKRSVFNNSEIDRVEDESGYKVKQIKIDFVDGKYKAYAHIDEDKKALRKEQKQLAKLQARQKKLDSQEVIISIKEGSLLYTLKTVILPNILYYKALLTYKEELFYDNDFKSSVKKYFDELYSKEKNDIENILKVFGLKPKDFELLTLSVLEEKYDEYSEFFEEMNLAFAPIKLWNEDDSVNAFSGMLRFIEKYIRNFFEGNQDMKDMVSEGAGRLGELILPFINYSKKLIGRELTKEEENIIIRIFHREFIKQKGTKKLPVATGKVKVKKEDKNKKTTNKKEEKKQEPKRDITININFYGSENTTDWKTRLKNLFGDDFQKVLLTIKQNLPEADSKEDIIDILGAIKIELEGKLRLKLTSTQSMGLHDIVKMILKEDDILKDIGDDIEPDNPEE